MRTKLLGHACVVAVMLCQPTTRATAQPAGATSDTQAVENWLASFSASVNDRDLAAYGRLWAEGADWAPPDAPLIGGREAILGSARATFEKYEVHHRFTAQRFRLGDGFGVAVVGATERFTPKGGGASWEQNVKGVIILRREQDGLWRGTHFIWNRDAAPTR